MPDSNPPLADTRRDFRRVSVLIAARNEEQTILPCLEAVARAATKLPNVAVLIADDQSTDHTATVVQNWLADKPAFHLISVENSAGLLRGKANALAQLARQAGGDALLFTDADTRVPSDWIQEMSRSLRGNVGIVTGVTLPDGPRLFDRLQSLDWLYNLTLLHLLSLFGVPLTAVGNNMAVSQDAYERIGGYESLPFSVVEDYTLFRAIVGQGFGFVNRFDVETLAFTKPVDTLTQLLHQRKRWMRGAMQLPVWMVTLLYAQALALVWLGLLGWLVSPVLAGLLYMVRLLIEFTVLSVGIQRLRQTKLWPYALLFEGYQLIMGPVFVLYYWFSGKLIWKGRQYP